MPDNEKEEVVEFEVRPTRSAIAAVVTGVLLIVIAFLTYKYFNSPQNAELGSGTSTSDESTITDSSRPEDNESETETLGSQSKGSQGSSAGRAQTPATPPSLSTGGPQTAWVANDYKHGDITGSSYTVKSGDTLWEIAEARYGNGADWVKIRDANSGNIGHLPNGSQALIVPGQVLNL